MVKLLSITSIVMVVLYCLGSILTAAGISAAISMVQEENAIFAPSESFGDKY